MVLVSMLVKSSIVHIRAAYGGYFPETFLNCSRAVICYNFFEQLCLKKTYVDRIYEWNMLKVLLTQADNKWS